MNKSCNMNIDTGEKTWLTPPEIINALGGRPQQQDLFAQPEGETKCS